MLEVFLYRLLIQNVRVYQLVSNCITPNPNF